jgi:outer membrane cobalamin receptor
MVKINNNDNEFDVKVGERFVIKKGTALPLPEEGHRFRLTDEFRHGSSWVEYVYEISDWTKVKQEPIRVNETFQYEKTMTQLVRENESLKESNKSLRTALSKDNEELDCLRKANRNQANTIDKLQEGNKEYEEIVASHECLKESDQYTLEVIKEWDKKEAVTNNIEHLMYCWRLHRDHLEKIDINVSLLWVMVGLVAVWEVIENVFFRR